MTSHHSETPQADDEMRRNIDLVVDIQIRIIAGAYEKANAYTNLIIVAGYAGLFALWQFTKDNLSRRQVIISGLLTITSLAIFVLFEIYKAHTPHVYCANTHELFKFQKIRVRLNGYCQR